MQSEVPTPTLQRSSTPPLRRRLGRRVVPFAMLAVLAVVILGSGTFRGADRDDVLTEIKRGPLQVWSVYEGSLESRFRKNIMSQSMGPVTIVELAAEGTLVRQGDVVARFDSSQVERDVVRLERDHALAKAELESLENAKLPLELRDLEMQLVDARAQGDSEAQYLADSRQLLAEDLVSEQEVKQQEAKAAAAKALVEKLELQLRLTKEYLHPSALERARATLASAEQELASARQNIESCTIKAPADGMVVYRPVHAGGEFRTVRVGDTLYRSQPFMALPDMNDPVVQCDVPESELSRVNAGSAVMVVPLAYPDLRLGGAVESVGTMAQSLTGRPGSQRYFHVVIGLGEADARLRDGMSVRVSILSYASADALLVPRLCVEWDGETPYCEIARGGRRVRRELKLGMANDQYFEVVGGLEAGDRVVMR